MAPPPLPPLILASRSPRRAALLRDAGYDFVTLAPPFDDPADPNGRNAQPDADASVQARILAEAKARSVLEIRDLWNASPQRPDGSVLILAADTIVVDAAGARLGQPADREQAAAMLDRLIDAEHQVVTGVCLLEATPAGVVRQASWVDTARVRIGTVAAADIEAYLDSGDWRGKAGAYNLAELRDRWPFEIVEGDPTTVVGLPMHRLRDTLGNWGQSETGSQPRNRSREQRLIAVMSGQARGLRADLARAALTCLTPAYAAAVGLRNAAFDLGLRRPHRLPRPTVSIGNITTGGTGKTPMTIELARQLAAAGHHPAVLLRGYRGRGESGSDEAVLLAQALDGMIVVADADRRAGADEALRRAAGRDVTVFLLDDGFQHRQAARDLDLVLLDATRPLGFGRLLPRGLLREPTDNLRRAHAVIVTRADQAAAEHLTKIDSLVQQLTGLRPMAHAAHVWDGLVDEAGRVQPMESLHGRTVVGLCGIANPGAFEAMLRQAGAHVLAMRTFDDHHRYTPADARAVGELARRSGAELLVMTEKDHVKWRRIAPGGADGPRVWRPRLAIRWLHGRDALGTLMDQRLGRPH